MEMLKFAIVAEVKLIHLCISTYRYIVNMTIMSRNIGGLCLQFVP